MLCFRRMYVSIGSNPASDLAASNKVYSPFPYACCCGILPVRLLITWYYKPPKTQPILGVTNHIYAPNRKTD